MGNGLITYCTLLLACLRWACGGWSGFCLAIFRGENREVITVDDYGNILDQKQREIITVLDQKQGGSGGSKKAVVGIGGVLLLVGIIAIASSGGADEPTSQASLPSTSIPIPTATPRPGIRDCLSVWDGHLDALENLVRPYLNDEGSMETHRTIVSRVPDAEGYHTVVMEYSAKNALGGRIKMVATGMVRLVPPSNACEVTLLDTGL